MTSTTTTNRSIRGSHAIRRPRVAGFLAAAVLVAGMSYVVGHIGAPVAPAARPADPGTSTPIGADSAAPIDVPGSASGVLVPGSVAQLDRSIAVWSANVAAEPRDFLSATTLAGLYHARGRLTGDLADHQRALDAAIVAEAAAPAEPAAKAIEAAIRFTLHDFDGALATAETLYAADPSQLGALATMADAKLELGRLTDARADYAQLATVASGPALDIRLARLAYVSGDATAAVRRAQGARDAVRAASRAGETVDLGFYEYAAAEYARLAGDPTSARAGYEAALAVRADDLGALVGLARIDAFEDRPAAALAGLERAVAIAPQPETLALLGDLQAASGASAEADRQFETVRFVKRLGEVQSTVFDRPLIRFELDHGGASEAVLEAARASLSARPDASGHDAVGWALYRLGRFTEAAGEIAAASPAGDADARIAFHAGAIALASGDAASARTWLERALALGPALDPIERAEAQRLLQP